LKAYEFAAQFVDGKAILDVGSGTGYETALLVKMGAQTAVGIDYAAEAIAFSKERYAQPNLSFLQMDAQEIASRSRLLIS
jgi:ubiquinone/menaquinone biosynthesis C-methylase UbiE